jgi:hypothetical protein
MPGTVGPTTGYTDRGLGKSVYPASSLQRVGKGGALCASGGNITVNVVAGNTAGNTNDTTEDLIFSQTLPANTFDIVGRQVLIEAYGSMPTGQTAIRHARIYFGSTTLVDFAAASGNTGVWVMSAHHQGGAEFAKHSGVD